jgi:glucose-1-phosphate cytidylyltransferase
MKVVILAGGLGTRLGERSVDIPKPMVPIGGRPILWHIMKIYAHYGYRDFVLCLGYKGDLIVDYFLHYRARTGDCTVDLSTGQVAFHNDQKEDWTVTLADTGVHTLKGARLKRIEHYLTGDTNLLTYGDGVADVDIPALLAHHKKMGKMVTLTGVAPPARFGALTAEGDILTAYEEKGQAAQGLINGGFMVFERALLSHLTPDPDCDLEYGAFEKLASAGHMAVYRHPGQWACMDHERDVAHLDALWRTGRAFWRVW